MKVRISISLLLIFIVSILPGCYSPGNVGITEIPPKNKIELDKVWEIKMDAQQSDYVIDGDKLYIVTWNQSVYMVDINSGEIIKNFKLNVEEIGEGEGSYCSGIAINDGILAINYENKIIVVDTTTEKVLLKYEAIKGPYVAIDYNILMYEDLLIFSNIIDKKIYAINYRTGEVKWEYGGDPVIHGKFTLFQYEDKYIYRRSTELAYFEFDPLTGNVMQKYQVESAGEIKNEKQSYFIPVFNNIENHQFNTWLRNRSFDVFYLTEKGYIFTEHLKNFYFHGVEGKLVWKLTFPKEIFLSRVYGRYAVLYFNEKNKQKSISILDLENEEIVWNIDYDLASKSRFFVYDDRLFLPGIDGSYKVYDLSKLEQ